ncbi:MAG: hypothetical protein ACREP7_15200 [Lysobacter sp.]
MHKTVPERVFLRGALQYRRLALPHVERRFAGRYVRARLAAALDSPRIGKHPAGFLGYLRPIAVVRPADPS